MPTLIFLGEVPLNEFPGPNSYPARGLVTLENTIGSYQREAPICEVNGDHVWIYRRQSKAYMVVPLGMLIGQLPVAEVRKFLANLERTTNGRQALEAFVKQKEGPAP